MTSSSVRPSPAARPSRAARSARRAAQTALALVLALAGACTSPLPKAPASGYEEASWRSLLRARPDPLAGAPAVAVERVDGVGVTESVGMAELMILRLLHRTDVVVVDRRRFSLASAREDRGLPAPPSAPALGTAPEIEWIVHSRVGTETERLRPIEVRLTRAATGELRATWTDTVAAGTSTVLLARRLGSLLLRGLDREGLLVDPPGYARQEEPETLPRADFQLRPVARPEEAFLAFMWGVVAEDRYDWADARAGYARAAELGGPGFFEPQEAMARVTRLRAGGALGSS